MICSVGYAMECETCGGEATVTTGGYCVIFRACSDHIGAYRDKVIEEQENNRTLIDAYILTNFDKQPDEELTEAEQSELKGYTDTLDASSKTNLLELK
jgi:hypothetical protein